MPDEIEGLAEIAGALYINMGTLLPISGETIPTGARAALALGKPWVLDPVGMGLGELRARILRELQSTPPAIVRGNASEIIALARTWGLDVASVARNSSSAGAQGASETGGVRGVDSTDSVAAARASALALAQFTGGAVAVSGPIDLVTNGVHVALCEGGSPLMERVTGFGCSLAGVCAVYSAIADPFTAALTASLHYNVAGTSAASVAPAPGSFKVAFLDALAQVAPEEVAQCPFTLEEA